MVAFSNFLGLGVFLVWSIAGFQRDARMLGDQGNPSVDDPARGRRTVTAMIRTDRETYSLAETVKLHFSLQNVGDQRVYVDRRMFWGGIAGGLKLVITDRSNKPVPFPGLLNDALMPPPKEGDEFILIPLDPGFSYGTVGSLRVADHFRRAGRYSIQVIYQSRLLKESVSPPYRTLPALWADAPEIPSGRIWITVR